MGPAAADPSAPAADIPERVIVATHYYATGPAFDLEEFLLPRTRCLLFIAHPLYGGGGRSYARWYEDGRLVKTLELPAGFRGARFIRDLLLTVRWVRQAGAYDLMIAGDNLLAMAGLWLRRTGRIRRLVLYSIDYVPRRFANPVLNRAYRAVDRLASRRANLVWNVSPAIEAARRARDGPRPTAPQLVVPVGTNVERIRRLPRATASPDRLAFVGNVLEKQGLQVVIRALPALRRALPSVSLLVLGDGQFLPEVKRLAEAAGVLPLIEFAGYIEDHREIERRLLGCAIGLAPYVPDAESFSRFADPGKIKLYLACGLPVILTDVPPIARLIEQRGAGRIVPYEPAEIARAIVGLLTSSAELDRARAAAAALGAEYSWDRLFARAFRESAPHLR